MPSRCASAVISSLSMPTSGRSTGSVATSLIEVRFSIVCDATWPTTSPVTSACARCCARDRLGDAHHQAAVDDDAQRRRAPTARPAAESRRTAPATAAIGTGTASAAAPARAPSPATRATGSDSCESGRTRTRQPRRIIRQAATGESMPPDSRQTTRPLDADRQAAGARVPCRSSRTPRCVSASTWIVSSGFAEIDVPAARLLDAAADLALDLRRRQRKPLVGAARRDAERSRLQSGVEVAQDLGGDRVDVERRPAGPGEVGDAEDTRRGDRGPRSQSAPSASTTSMRPMSGRTSRTPRSRGRLAQVAHQPRDEPRPVLALQRDFLVVNDRQTSCSSELHCESRGVCQRCASFAVSAASGPVAADDRALDRARQPGVDPVAGEDRALRRRPRRRAAAAGPAPARTSPASRGPPCRAASVAARAPGSASAISRAARAISVVGALRGQRVGAARDERQVRRAREPNAQPLVEDPLHRRGQAARRTARPSPAGRTRGSP